MGNLLQVNKNAGLVTLTLNGPESKNALDLELCRQFMLETMALPRLLANAPLLLMVVKTRGHNK